MTADEERAAELRRRAERLRAEPLRADPLPEPEDFAAGRIGGVDDPDDSDLLRRWAEEDHLEAGSPHRNWSPVIAVVVVLAVLAAIAGAFVVVLGSDDGGATDAGPGGETADGPSVLDDEPPSLDELTADVTVPPGPEVGLSVADKGVTIVEDRFDPARREGTFAVILENPHPDWMAQGVQVDVQFLDPAGTAVGGDSAFVELVLPSQRVAVAALFFDAPTVPVADMSVAVDVARWRETGPVEGGFTTTDVTTEEAEFSGVRTTFTLRSTFPEPLTDVGATVVYRGALGQIVGGSDTFLDRVDPEVDTPVEVALLANIALDQVTATEVYPSASFGFVADD